MLQQHLYNLFRAVGVHISRWLERDKQKEREREREREVEREGEGGRERDGEREREREREGEEEEEGESDIREIQRGNEKGQINRTADGNHILPPKCNLFYVIHLCYKLIRKFRCSLPRVY